MVTARREKVKCPMRCANISIVIPTYERPETLKMTIESYLDGRLLPKEIIVVDQSSKVFDPASLGNTRGSTVKVVPIATPSSTYARNVGVRHATTDTILFSDDFNLYIHVFLPPQRIFEHILVP